MCYIEQIEELKLKVKKLEARIKELESPDVAITDADILAIAGRVESCPVSPWWLKGDVVCGDVQAAALRFARALLAAAHRKEEKVQEPGFLEVNLNLPKGDLVRVYVDGKASYRPLADVTTLEIPELGERIIRMDPLLYEGEEAIHSLDGRITIVRTKA